MRADRPRKGIRVILHQPEQIANIKKPLSSSGFFMALGNSWYQAGTSWMFCSGMLRAFSAPFMYSLISLKFMYL
jgi:hypothetical protein